MRLQLDVGEPTATLVGRQTREVAHGGGRPDVHGDLVRQAHPAAQEREGAHAAEGGGGARDRLHVPLETGKRPGGATRGADGPRARQALRGRSGRTARTGGEDPRRAATAGFEGSRVRASPSAAPNTLG